MIKRLLDTKARYERMGNFGDWHFDMFLRFGRKFYHDRAKYWRIRQACEKATWSTLFSAFQKIIGK